MENRDKQIIQQAEENATSFFESVSPGNFYKSGLAEYQWGMSTMMKDPDYLYVALVDDIYFPGKVLGRKYNLVRLAYGVFMIGIIVSVFAFISAILFHEPAPSTVIIEGSGSPF